MHVEHVAREDEASAPLNPCQPDRGVPASFSLARSLGRSAFDRGSMCHRKGSAMPAGTFELESRPATEFGHTQERC